MQYNLHDFKGKNWRIRAADSFKNKYIFRELEDAVFKIIADPY